MVLKVLATCKSLTEYPCTDSDRGLVGTSDDQPRPRLSRPLLQVETLQPPQWRRQGQDRKSKL